MAKKKFERKVPRPTLAASLEAVRQGRVIEPVVEERPREQAVAPVAVPPASTDTALVRQEVKRITATMAVLILLLIFVTIVESRTGFLTSITSQVLGQF